MHPSRYQPRTPAVAAAGVNAGTIPAGTSRFPQRVGGGNRDFTLTPPQQFGPAEETLNFSVLILGLFLLTVSSLSSQILTVYLHVPIPLIGLAQAAALLAYAAAGNHFDFMKTPFGPRYLILAVWWVVASLLGEYPRGSLTEIGPYLFRLHVLPLLFVAIGSTAGRVRLLMNCFAWGYVMVIGFCFLYGSANNGEARFAIPETSLANPNDLALHLLLGGSFILVFFRNALTRLVAIGSLPMLGWYVLKTGSRSNLLAILVVIAVSAYIMPPEQRKRLIVGAVLGILLIIPLVPRASWNRLLTFSEVDYEEMGSRREAQNASRAVGSTMARAELQKRAVMLSIFHPVFGVGPKMFANAADKMVRESTGKKSSWQGAHNTYLQVAAESGIPGLILYAGCILLMLKTNFRSYRLTQEHPALREYSLNTFALVIASVVFSFDIFFAHIAFDYHLPVLIGFTAANEIGLRKLIPRTPPSQPRGQQGAVSPRPFRQGLPVQNRV